MVDYAIKTRFGKLLSVHLKTPEYDPVPGRDPDYFCVFWVLGVPAEVSVLDLVNVFGWLDYGGEELRFVWPWEDLNLRRPVGEILSLAEAAARIGLSAPHLAKATRAGTLPAFRSNAGTGKSGEAPMMVNGQDLAWFVETVRKDVRRGRPRK